MRRRGEGIGRDLRSLARQPRLRRGPPLAALVAAAAAVTGSPPLPCRELRMIASGDHPLSTGDERVVSDVGSVAGELGDGFLGAIVVD